MTFHDFAVDRTIEFYNNGIYNIRIGELITRNKFDFDVHCVLLNDFQDYQGEPGYNVIISKDGYQLDRVVMTTHGNVLSVGFSFASIDFVPLTDALKASLG